MIILGVADCADASAALVVNGTLVAAVAQERIDRQRHSRAFPSGAIDAVLDCAGIRARDVDRVVFGTAFSPSTLLRARPALLGRVTPRLSETYRGYQSALRKSGLYRVEQDISKKLLEPRIRGLGFERASLEMLEHDRAHATAAYRCQPRADALVLTLDTPGDGAAISVSVGRNLQLQQLFLQTALAGVSTFAGRVARHLGVDPGDVYGLASSGTAPMSLAEAFLREIRFDGGAFAKRRMVAEPDPMVAQIRSFAPADVAAAAQYALVESALAFVRHWVAQTRMGHVVVAGALFADPYLCGRILADASIESLSVFPAMGDDGLAVGAALGAAGSPARRLPSLALGPRFTEPQCYKALSLSSLPRNKVDHPEQEIATLIARGRTVARFSDAMEFGPHALGNRSVLFRADDRALSARAVAALQRPIHQAVGVCLPAALAQDSFGPIGRGFDSARFRTFALPATAAFARACPGVVQADGTALPQVVWPTEEGGLTQILDHVAQRTGHPAVGHLAFQVGAEPLVCSLLDAVQSWRASAIDTLFLGPYRVDRASHPRDTSG